MFCHSSVTKKVKGNIVNHGSSLGRQMTSLRSSSWLPTSMWHCGGKMVLCPLLITRWEKRMLLCPHKTGSSSNVLTQHVVECDMLRKFKGNNFGVTFDMTFSITICHFHWRTLFFNATFSHAAFHWWYFFPFP